METLVETLETQWKHNPIAKAQLLHRPQPELDRTSGACEPSVTCTVVRVCERYQENTVQLLNRNNKQTIGVVNKQKTNSWVLNKQLAWSSHRGLHRDCKNPF